MDSPGDTQPLVRVAAVQAAPVFLNRAATITKATGLMRQAASHGAQLVVFPESFVPCYPVWLWGGRANVESDAFARLYANAVAVPGPDTACLSEVVRSIVPRGEVPTELAGTYEFKGIGDQIPVYRTCFGTSPVVRERLVLVHINFVGVQRLADEFGWDIVHPRLDEITARIIASTREAGGSNRGVGETGCLLSFPSVGSALGAYTLWAAAAAERTKPPARCFSVGVRCAIHWGRLNVMRFTIMGRDIEVVRTLAALGTDQQVLLTDPAVDCARAEGLIPSADFVALNTDDLRRCTSLSRWKSKFQDIPVYALSANHAVSAVTRQVAALSGVVDQ